MTSHTPPPEGSGSTAARLGATDATGIKDVANATGTAAAQNTPQDKPEIQPQPWAGRIGIVVGIVLLGLSLRYAVTGLSPLLPLVREDLGIGNAGATLIGMLPTLMFGLGGFTAPVFARRTSYELVAVTAMALATIGAVSRALVSDPTAFIFLSAVALFGMGLGNVVGAPLVKKYFPDRQNTMLTVFALLMQAGATLPSFTAMPLNNAFDWRVSLASWGLISFLAIFPWAVQLFRKKDTADSAAERNAADDGGSAYNFGLGSLLKAPVALGTGLFYAMASFNTYAVLAWLPTILGDRGLSPESAAGIFSIYTFLTLPMALIVPIVAARMKQPFTLAAALALVHMVGFIGLLLVPSVPAVWVTIMGLGGGAFPLAIQMFNRRTRTQAGSGALSGFAMGVGYLFGTLGPLVGGWLNSATGGWSAAMWVYAASGIFMLLGAFMMTRPNFLEDQVPRKTTAA